MMGDGDDAVAGMKLAHADQAEVGEIQAPVGVPVASPR